MKTATSAMSEQIDRNNVLDQADGSTTAKSWCGIPIDHHVELKKRSGCFRRVDPGSASSPTIASHRPSADSSTVPIVTMTSS